MSRRPRWILGIVLCLFAAVAFGGPLHLALEAHDWVHEEGEEERSQGSHHEPHPSADHQFVAVGVHIKSQPTPIEVALVECLISLPSQACQVDFVPTEPADPPQAPESPPRRPRAPPQA